MAKHLNEDVIQELFRLGDRMADILEHDRDELQDLAREWCDACVRFGLYRDKTSEPPNG